MSKHWLLESHQPHHAASGHVLLVPLSHQRTESRDGPAQVAIIFLAAWARMAGEQVWGSPRASRCHHRCPPSSGHHHRHPPSHHQTGMTLPCRTSRALSLQAPAQPPVCFGHPHSVRAIKVAMASPANAECQNRRQPCLPPAAAPALRCSHHTGQLGVATPWLTSTCSRCSLQPAWSSLGWPWHRLYLNVPKMWPPTSSPASSE